MRCILYSIGVFKTHPVLVNDIYYCHQLALVRTECNKGNAADLDKALKHLEMNIQDTGDEY